MAIKNKHYAIRMADEIQSLREKLRILVTDPKSTAATLIKLEVKTEADAEDAAWFGDTSKKGNGLIDQIETDE